MKDKLTCQMLCNEHADHHQEDKQDSESPHCCSRWFLPQVMLQVMKLVVVTALLFATWVARNRFIVPQLPPDLALKAPDNFHPREGQLKTADHSFLYGRLFGLDGRHWGLGIRRKFFHDWNSYKFTSFCSETNTYEWNLARVLMLIWAVIVVVLFHFSRL